MDIYIRFGNALEFIRYDEPGIEELVDFWISRISSIVIPEPEAILAIYYRLCQGEFGMEHYPGAWGEDSDRMVVIDNVERSVVVPTSVCGKEKP